MSVTLPKPHTAEHLLSSESKKTMAKAQPADVRKAETDARWMRLIGKAVEQAGDACGWNLDELADACDRDARQVARWIAGKEHAQFAVLFQVVRLQVPLVLALARLATDVEVSTEIRMREAR